MRFGEHDQHLLLHQDAVVQYDHHGAVPSTTCTAVLTYTKHSEQEELDEKNCALQEWPSVSFDKNKTSISIEFEPPSSHSLVI